MTRLQSRSLNITGAPREEGGGNESYNHNKGIMDIGGLIR